jgi:hypothetical protein
MAQWPCLLRDRTVRHLYVRLEADTSTATARPRRQPPRRRTLDLLQTPSHGRTRPGFVSDACCDSGGAAKGNDPAPVLDEEKCDPILGPIWDALQRVGTVVR